MSTPHPTQQLSLLDAEHLPPALRLDARTCRIGLAGVARARAALAASRQQRLQREAAEATARRPSRAA